MFWVLQMTDSPGWCVVWCERDDKPHNGNWLVIAEGIRDKKDAAEFCRRLNA
jgi:hypothetical protein